MSKALSALGMIVGVIALLLYNAVWIYAGYVGISHYFGTIWACAAIFLVLLGFTLPITIGAFFGAMDVWHWHWALAALFVAPGLVFIFPYMLISSIKKRE